jgi:glycosyltransferase involved in cell wall biosynthesis
MAAERRLRIAVLGDLDGVHTRSWLSWLVAGGQDVHAVSYYAPREPIEGATVHALRGRAPAGAGGTAASVAGRLPRGLARLAHGARFMRAGLRSKLRAIAPDVVHAHFVVEHGFYGALAGVHPFVITAWGSDVLVEPDRDPLSGWIARWTLRRADAVTSNNGYMADRIVALGAPRAKVHLVTLGADRFFIERAADSVNARPPAAPRGPVVLSTRAHEALYNIEEIIEAQALVQRQHADARLVIAHSGALSDELRRHAARASVSAEFTGTVDRTRLRELMSGAEVFVSVPSSDATSVALLQAMAAGCFPVVSDLPALQEWIDDGVNGFLVPLHRPDALAARISEALDRADLRRDAADMNRRRVEQRGLNETQMEKMEAIFRGLVEPR